MISSAVAQRERTLELANLFVMEMRRELERALASGNDFLPRIRSVHERVGHATPEYRTLAIPIAPGTAGASPEVLSGMIARYAAQRPPLCLLLALEALTQEGEGEQNSVLILEARDQGGTRRFYMQRFRWFDGVLEWAEPTGGGWWDPGEEEMILDAAFMQ